MNNAPLADPLALAAPARVLAVSSGKGGVGKSSVALNLAISLSQSGDRVCLLDTDSGLANINILLGINPTYRLEHVLQGSRRIDEVMVNGPAGVTIIPGANGLVEGVDLDVRQRCRLAREWVKIEREFDYLLVDTAAGIGEATLDMLAAVEQVVMVITPEPTSLTDAFSLIKLMQQRGESCHYQVVVNLCSSVAQAKTVFNRFNAALRKYLGIEAVMLGMLPIDDGFRRAVIQQSPAILLPENDALCRHFKQLASHLQGSEWVTPRKLLSRQWGSDQFDGTLNPADPPSEESELPAESPVVLEGVEDEPAEAQSSVPVGVIKPHPESDQAALEQSLRELLERYRDRFGALPEALWAELAREEPRDTQHSAEPEVCSLQLAEREGVIGFDRERFGSQQELLARVRALEPTQPIPEWLSQFKQDQP